uniref:Uncharacterized protein n=3 Tax=Cacopsylla melanoneura TaxID=428564 RepID=A0A8D8W2L4_9HEMI
MTFCLWFQMITLGSLFDRVAPDPGLERVKRVIAASLPAGWRDWTVGRQALENSVDVGHKARFAIPSVQLFQALAPSALQISERHYKKMKCVLLSWPLGKALVFSPSSISIHLRGSKQAHDAFMRKLDSIWPSILSRGELNQVLASIRQREALEPPSPDYEPLSPPRVNPSSESLQSQISALRNTVSSLVAALRPQPLASAAATHASYVDTHNDVDTQYQDSEKDSDDTLSSSEEEEEEVNAERFSAPRQVPSDPWGKGSALPQPCSAPGSFFSPLTSEKDPDVLDPSPVLAAQAIQCQRLGGPGWNRVRYLEAEKRLKRTGVFQPLEMNQRFASPPSDFLLRKQERLLGSITHGLLAQRQAFQKCRESIVSSCPAAAPLIDKFFLEESSEFRQESDALLQFACGKRAEILADRRKAVEPKGSESRRRLRQIPPSSSHLYDEDQLAKWSSVEPAQQRPQKRPAPDANLGSPFQAAKKQRFVSFKKKGGGEQLQRPQDPSKRSFKGSQRTTSQKGMRPGGQKSSKRF